MCGIAGFSLAPDEKVAPTRLAAALLRGIEHRGKDATGAAWVMPKTLEVFFQKAPVKASDFIPQLNLEGARTCILHTRFATKGAVANNDNNHPIVIPGMVGIHNGVLYNDDELFAMLGDEVTRYAQVDSEAAFALLNASDDTPVTERLALLDGSAALAWLHVDDEGLSDRVLHIARVSSSPVWIGKTPKGSVIFASTRATLENAERELGVKMVTMQTLTEGTYVKVHRGRIQSITDIPIKRRAIEAIVHTASSIPGGKVNSTKVGYRQPVKVEQADAEVQGLLRAMSDDDGYWAWKRDKATRR